MRRLRRPRRPAGTAAAHPAHRWWAGPAVWFRLLGAVVLLAAAMAAGAGHNGPNLGPAAQVTGDDSAGAVADDPAARERAAARDPVADRSDSEMYATVDSAATVEELLEHGLGLVGASPVHLAVRGTAGSDTVRCGWRGIARTTSQREDSIRAWLQLRDGDSIPAAGDLEELFTATFDVLNPEYRETIKSNFLAIARGGLSEEYLFLTCFADYAVSSYLLGAGPTTVTVAYDRRDEARSYELYRREHEAGTFGTDALQTRGDYEASLQDLVVAAAEELAAEIGGKERIVFLAPMGAHNAIAFEAWQAVAHWDVATVDGTVSAVRVGAPAGDPEHTQTLANLTSRDHHGGDERRARDDADRQRERLAAEVPGHGRLRRHHARRR